MPTNQNQKHPSRNGGDIKCPGLPESGRTRQEESTNSEKTSKKKEEKWPHRIQAGAAAALVVITFFYTFYAGQQAGAAINASKAAQDAANAAKDANTKTQSAIDQGGREFENTLGQMKLQTAQQKRTADAAGQQLNEFRSSSETDQRAWVGIDGVVVPAQLISSPGGEEGTKFGWVIKNSGKTPALDIRYWMGGKTFPATLQYFPGIAGQVIHDAGVLSPGQAPIFPFHTIALPPEFASLVLSGHDIYSFQICLTYKDIFRAPHWLTGCLQYSPWDQGYTTCPQHNETDTQARKPIPKYCAQ